MSIDIVLDPRNEQELLDQVTRYLFNRSNGTLTNLNESNPLIFLLEAQVFAGSELLWYLNQLPDKLLLSFLQRFETLQDQPVKATGQLLLNLTAPLLSSYTINALEVSNGSAMYKLTSPVTFPANTTQATGLIEAVDPGNSSNTASFTINKIITPTAFLDSVTNLNPLTNGKDQITADEAINNFISGFRDSQLISLEDYKTEVTRIVGSAYLVRVLYDDGILVLVGDPENNPPISLLQSIYQYLVEKSVLTANIKVQELDYVDCSVFLSVSTDRLTEGLPDQVYTEVIQMIRDKQVLSTHHLVELSGKLGLRFIDGWVDNVFGVEIKDNEMFNPKYVQLKINGFNYFYGDSGDVE